MCLNSNSHPLTHSLNPTLAQKAVTNILFLPPTLSHAPWLVSHQEEIWQETDEPNECHKDEALSS